MPEGIGYGDAGKLAAGDPGGVKAAGVSSSGVVDSSGRELSPEDMRILLHIIENSDKFESPAKMKESFEGWLKVKESKSPRARGATAAPLASRSSAPIPLPSKFSSSQAAPPISPMEQAREDYILSLIQPNPAIAPPPGNLRPALNERVIQEGYSLDDVKNFDQQRQGMVNMPPVRVTLPQFSLADLAR